MSRARRSDVWQSSRPMAERAAIVTGASRGIGLALAEVLADEGYGLTIAARKPDTLERAANTLRARRTLRTSPSRIAG